MATSTAIPSYAFLEAFLPVARASLFPHVSTTSGQIAKRIPLLHRLRSSILPSVIIPIPSLLDTIWEGILKAVPKKKTSHSKKRHRQMAGKALKDVTALNTCSSCGRTKRAHVLCPYCVQNIKTWFTDKLGIGDKMKEQEFAVAKGLKKELRLMSKDRLYDLRQRARASKEAQGGQEGSESSALP